MRNITDILKDYGVEIPAEKLTDFNKAFNENYKTIVEHQKALDKVTAATKRAETAEEALKGFDGMDPANFQKQLDDAKKAVKDAQEAAQKQIEERDFNDALKSELETLKFSSGAARKAVEAEIRAAGLKLKNGKILGLSDLIEQIKTSDADAFVTEADQNKVRFTQPNSGNGNAGSGMTKKDIMAIKNDNERYAMIEKHKDLFLRRE